MDVDLATMRVNFSVTVKTLDKAYKRFDARNAEIVDYLKSNSQTPKTDIAYNLLNYPKRQPCALHTVAYHAAITSEHKQLSTKPETPKYRLAIDHPHLHISTD